MNRRELLWVAGLTACAPKHVAATGARIKAICFDLFTLFDPRGVVDIARSVVGDAAPALWDTWKVRQFEYAWLRSSANQYADFHVVTSEALAFAARAHGLTLSASQQARLVDAYSELEVWSDTRAQLEAWRRAGLRLAPLANYAPAMLERLIAHGKLEPFFETLISTDAARAFKPDPRAYALGPQRLGLEREEVCFAAFGGWDAAGARWFGFPTFWVNRLGVSPEALGPGPHATGPGLGELAAWLAAGGR